MAGRYDLISMGRSSIDLYSNDAGAAFADIASFAAFVGGCPTNIAVGTRRLGLRSLLLTALGNDPVGEFVIKFLQREGVETAFIPRKSEHRTSAVLLGIEPPDRFPLVYYRDNCADIQLTIDDVEAVPIADSRLLLISGTGLSRDPSRTATIYAAERARAQNRRVLLDLDFRADQWTASPARDVRAFGVTVRSMLHLVDVVLGTEEELKAALLSDTSHVTIEHDQVSAPQVKGSLDQAVSTLLALGPRVVVVKRGKSGSSVFTPEQVVHADAFAVDVLNVLGAGDAFASGFIYGLLRDWHWQRCARMGNAVGAIVVTRQGCANFMPTLNEVQEFLRSQDALDLLEETGCRS